MSTIDPDTTDFFHHHFGLQFTIGKKGSENEKLFSGKWRPSANMSFTKKLMRTGQTDQNSYYSAIWKSILKKCTYP